MPAHPTPFAVLQRTVAAWHTALDDGWPVEAAPGMTTALGEAMLRISCTNHSQFKRRLDIAIALGLPVREWRALDQEFAASEIRRYAHDEEYHEWAGGPRQPASQKISPPKISPAATTKSLSELVDQIIPLLRRAPLTISEIASKLGVSIEDAPLLVQLAHSRGAALQERGGRWHLDTIPPAGSSRQDGPQLLSDDDGVIVFGAVGDTHLGSKYERLDCLNDYYNQFERWGISTVLHAGNWIDGEATFNRHDLKVHGMDAQMKYLAEHYPQRKGVETWAIAGADHEGWYSRREGVDVGRYAENVMRAAGRQDWHDMGYMECFIPMVHKATGRSSKLCLMHPGGGSAYAISYAPQKIVEGFDGGDKPAVLILGHYHKASWNLIRNVHTVQTGTFEDQTLFMRQKKIAAHLGGSFCKLRLDPETGAVTEFTFTFRNYFVKSYYEGRWSEHGPVKSVTRSAVP
jgi:hypothetical protein